MMKVLKRIGLFLVYPSVMLLAGFWGGVQATRFFYPGVGDTGTISPGESYPGVHYSAQKDSGEHLEGSALRQPDAAYPDGAAQSAGLLEEDAEEIREVSLQRETLSVDTEYVLLETDVLRETEVETTWKLPHQYVGLDREQFVAAMENYENYPPLSEMERGFVSLEVLSFSRERVVVRMNYRYVQPGEGFYLAVQNHEVVVYLEDQETVYINTGILLESLPEELQLEIIEMLYVEDEGSLYNLLESYSS